VFGSSVFSGDIGETIGEWVSGLFPPSEDGIITSGSPNTHTNSKPAARAAGMIEPQGTEDTDAPIIIFIDIAARMLAGFKEVAKLTIQQTIRPTVASPDPRAVPKDDDKITCDKHPHPFGTHEYLAEGSSKIYINGQPAVRSNDRSTCETKLTDNCEDGVKVSNIV
jgi:uncharacterized Zn-binding protein involved in type VI secretion